MQHRIDEEDEHDVKSIGFKSAVGSLSYIVADCADINENHEFNNGRSSDISATLAQTTLQFWIMDFNWKETTLRLTSTQTLAGLEQRIETADHMW